MCFPVMKSIVSTLSRWCSFGGLVGAGFGDRLLLCDHGRCGPAGAECGAVDHADLGTGGQFTVVRIPEELEFEEGQLAFLESCGLMPGRVGTVQRIVVTAS